MCGAYFEFWAGSLRQRRGGIPKRGCGALPLPGFSRVKRWIALACGADSRRHRGQWIWRRWHNSNTGRTDGVVPGPCGAAGAGRAVGRRRPDDTAQAFFGHWKMQRVWRKSGGAKQWIELFEKTKTSVDLVVRCVAGNTCDALICDRAGAAARPCAWHWSFCAGRQRALTGRSSASAAKE